jgi:hypothetical protein
MLKRMEYALKFRCLFVILPTMFAYMWQMENQFIFDSPSALIGIE